MENRPDTLLLHAEERKSNNREKHKFSPAKFSGKKHRYSKNKNKKHKEKKNIQRIIGDKKILLFCAHFFNVEKIYLCIGFLYTSLDSNIYGNVARCRLAVWLAGCDTAEFQTTSAMPTSCLLDVQLEKRRKIGKMY